MGTYICGTWRGLRFGGLDATLAATTEWQLVKLIVHVEETSLTFHLDLDARERGVMIQWKWIQVAKWQDVDALYSSTILDLRGNSK